jgi:hypothetical protein
MFKKLTRIFAASLFALALALAPSAALADDSSATSGGSRAGGIALDLLVGRPTLLLATISGAIFYGVSLPVTLASGAERDARDRFVTTPWQMLTSPLGE